MDIVDLYIAKKKLKIKKIDSKSVFLTTMWKNEIITCTFNMVTSKLSQLSYSKHLNSEETGKLENIIIKCLSGKIK